MRPRILILAIGLMLTSFIVIYAGINYPFTVRITNDVLINQNELKKIIKTKGIDEAYVFFKKNFSKYDATSKHYVGHFLGQESYRIMGDKGLSMCDFGLDYGCIHGFVIAGIGEKGNGFIETSMKRCEDFDPNDVRRGSCVHGVSHTLLYLKGYSYNDLVWSLKQCDQMLSSDKFVGPVGCYEAVFMEYNLRNLDGESTGKWFETRPLDDARPLYPCDVIDNRYKNSCYSELGSMWSNNIGMDFSKMFSFCGGIINRLHLNSCYWGVGRSMADDYQFDYKRVETKCSEIKDGGKQSCIEGASVVLSNNGVKEAVSICSALDADSALRCKKIFE